MSKSLEKRNEELLEAAKPLIKFLNENFNPHAMVIVTIDGAEVVMGECRVTTDEFVGD